MSKDRATAKLKQLVSSIPQSDLNWKVQEIEDDLFIVNERTGKKYKINLSEV